MVSEGELLAQGYHDERYRKREALRVENERLREIEAAARRYLRAEDAIPGETLRGILNTHDTTVGAEWREARAALRRLLGL